MRRPSHRQPWNYRQQSEITQKREFERIFVEQQDMQGLDKLQNKSYYQQRSKNARSQISKTCLQERTTLGNNL